jgi:hypothetical protein
VKPDRSKRSEAGYALDATYSPLAITNPDPKIVSPSGTFDQKSQSIATAQSIEEYSRGATTNGGAPWKARVMRYCPAAPAAPTPSSQAKCSVGTARQVVTAIAAAPQPTSAKNQNTMAARLFSFAKTGTVNAFNEYATADTTAATLAREVSPPDAGWRINITPHKHHG